VANRFLKAPSLQHYVDQNVELGYAFDVHCNAFFPLLLILHVLQIFLISGTLPLPLPVELPSVSRLLPPPASHSSRLLAGGATVVAQPWFLSTALADTLWLTALGYYLYITFLGYSGTTCTAVWIPVPDLWLAGDRSLPLRPAPCPFAPLLVFLRGLAVLLCVAQRWPPLWPTVLALPFLHRTEVFLYPIAIVFLLYVVALATQWNVSMTVFRYYGFHRNYPPLQH
jgi:hypothetical protein